MPPFTLNSNRKPPLPLLYVSDLASLLLATSFTSLLAAKPQVGQFLHGSATFGGEVGEHH